MSEFRRYLTITTVALVLAGAASIAYAQTPASGAQRAPTAPGVTRAVEHPDPSVDQTQPDSSQPATAVDPPASGPETAKDDHVGQPETATDAPKPTPPQGVRSNTPSNTPPPQKPRD